MRGIVPVVMCLVLLAAGCGVAGEDPTPGPTAAERAVIAAADAADGAEDHVVSKCAVCGLNMDGSPEFASEYAGATFHFCSTDCKALFDKDPHAVLARLEE